jgi:glycosyltransferase involved in cell wall biosynthesis
MRTRAPRFSVRRSGPDVRIALASLDYPPRSTEGVARQRHALAEGLLRIGHDVHVVTLGTRRESVNEGGVWVHRYARSDAVNTFLTTLPVLDRPLTDAQLLCEGVLELADRLPIDVVDVPLWLAQPLALVRHAPCPVVIWLQTTLLHLIELQQRDPRAHEKMLADIDRFGLTAAAGCIADSHSILSDVERLYDLPGLAARTPVVYPGLPDTAPASATSKAGDGFEVLVVGRLEQRKGTRLLLDALPRLLGSAPGMRIRFVGRDNSAADGFQRETGLTYPDAFARRYPELASRVRFDGYVDDAMLAERYAAADVLLHAALYESFGLVFLEAMRASLPTVAFRSGGAAEVFSGGERDGAVLCEPVDTDGLIAAVAALARQPERRAALGRAARCAFEAGFTSQRMARETAAGYARIIADRRAGSIGLRRSSRMFQVMEALQDRDAVSRIARTNASTLAELGAERPILALFAEATVRAETGRLRGARFHGDDTAIFHYWGFSRLERVIERFSGRKAIHYHNITPPHFFAGRTAHYEMTTRGYAQLDRIADRFDLVIGDSNYNLEGYALHLSVPRPMLCVYPVVDAEALQAAPWNEDLAARTSDASDGAVWLFVGRFAPNKRQDDVMRAFDRYAAGTGTGRLLLVGDMTAVPAFVEQLADLRERLPNGGRIEFVPSVGDESLRAYYRAADLFVCASEHEGFCMPLAEAMAFDVPTLALDKGAVGETLGASGLLVSEWDPQDVANLAAQLLGSPERRETVVAAQRERLRAFSPAAIRRCLGDVVRYLREGTQSPLFIYLDPGRLRRLEAS